MKYTVGQKDCIILILIENSNCSHMKTTEANRFNLGQNLDCVHNQDFVPKIYLTSEVWVEYIILFFLPSEKPPEYEGWKNKFSMRWKYSYGCSQKRDAWLLVGYFGSFYVAMQGRLNNFVWG